ncbi:protein of unknown function [Ruminococcaceae bacterium BL-6]|nr:protein of unknown function [Ruminococcaceae bacterium BL-6]
MIRLSQIKKIEKSVEKKALFSGPAAESARPRLKAGAAEKSKGYHLGARTERTELP